MCVAHDFPEVVQAVEGEGLLGLKTGALRLTGRHACLVLPGTLHAEGALRRRAYRMLWGMAGPSGSSFLISVCDAGGRQHAEPVRHWMEHGESSRFWEAATAERASVTARDRGRLQGLLLGICADALDGLERPSPLAFHRHMAGQIRQHLDRNYARPITVASLAEMVRCTPNYLNTLFRREAGAPIHQYLLGVRLEHARRMLATGQMQVKEAAYRAGFADPLYFSRVFRSRFGHPPSEHGTRAPKRASGASPWKNPTA
jgi:AraC-like DNA-binding protein